ncbi:MAG: acetylglutamate kinase [Chloroflexi bacterium]|nr:acetylglutamate kinase [Chloroflexota bacterium]
MAEQWSDGQQTGTAASAPAPWSALRAALAETGIAPDDGTEAIARHLGAPLVVKLGGSVGPGETVLQEIAWLRQVGVWTVLVHGGGPLITAWLDRVGKTTQFVDGLRYTDGETLDMACMVLAGLVNTQLVAALGALGGRGWGLSGVDGALLRASVRDARLGLVGEVERVDADLLQFLCARGYTPVLAPIAVRADGQPLNVNADAVAGVVAAAMGARELVFLTDVPGVLDASGQPLHRLTPSACAQLAADGVIRGGMRPKVEACARAAAAGATSRIVDGRAPYSLLRALCVAESGTVVVPDAAER